MKDFIETLLKEKLTPMMYALLLCLNTNREFPWKISQESMDQALDYLKETGFIIIKGDQVILKAKALSIIDQEVSDEKLSLKTCESWINDWIELWPKGVKSGGRPVRGSRDSIIKKMNNMLLNKKYDPQDVIDATSAYISALEPKGYMYITCADYFISKSGSSLLEALLEEFDREKFEQESSGKSDFYTLL